MFDPYAYEAIDWDDEDDEEGNLAHCLGHDVDEAVVAEVLALVPVEIKMKLQSADFAVVGPDASGAFWTLLFDVSYKRGDWLRPVTGWRASESQFQAWRQATKGRR